MLISRSSMKQQLKGNRMKKKSVVKKNVGKILETVSPVYSIAKGKGPASQLASAGAFGLLPALAARPQRKKAKARATAKSVQPKRSGPSAGMGMTEMNRMFAGGEVKRSRPIDGIVVKGKTRA